MRRLSVVLLGGMIVACCAATPADSIRRRSDPEVIIAGGKGTIPVGSVFSFISPSGTSPINLSGGSPCMVGVIAVLDCIFGNATGSTWTSLTFTITPNGQIGPLLCVTLAYFTKCSFNADGTQVTFSGGPGIPAGNDFLVEVLLWRPKTQFSGSAQESGQLVFRRQPALRGGAKTDFDAAPELLAVGLLLSGFGTALLRQRLWLSAHPEPTYLG